MPAGGNNIKPTSIKLFHGTNRKCRDKRQKVKPKSKPRMPRGLDSTAKAHWKFILAERSEWIGASDAAALEQVCRTWSLLKRATAEYDKDVTDYRARANFIALQTSWVSLSARFGLSPTDRERMGEASDGDSKNELKARFLG